MGKRVMLGQKAKSGDYIQNDKLKQKWVACTCPTCNGSGLESNGYTMTFKCSKCEGQKIIWKETQYVD